MSAVQLRVGHGETARRCCTAEGRRRAERDERVHVRACGASRLLKPLMKNFWLMTMTMTVSSSWVRPMATWLPSNQRGQRPAPHHVTHGEVHQHDQEAQRPAQAAFELRGFVVFEGFLRGGCALLAFRALDACAIARILHCADNFAVRRRAFDAHARSSAG